MQYIECLSNLCDLNTENEYSLHHEFSDAVTSLDVEHVTNIVSFIKSHKNPFNGRNEISNIVTGAVFNSDDSSYLVNCMQIGEDAYQKYIKQRFIEKSKQLFDVIHKTFKRKKVSVATKSPDIQKENLKALKFIDYARLRNYNVEELLKYELASTSFYLTKDNLLRKTQKSELGRSLEEKLKKSIPAEVPIDSKKTAIVFDFMAYARKVSLSKLNTFGDFASMLWKTFKYLSIHCQRIHSQTLLSQGDSPM